MKDDNFISTNYDAKHHYIVARDCETTTLQSQMGSINPLVDASIHYPSLVMRLVPKVSQPHEVARLR